MVAKHLGLARSTLRKALAEEGLPTEAGEPASLQGEGQPQEAGI